MIAPRAENGDGPEPSVVEDEHAADGIRPFVAGGHTFECRVRRDGRYVWRSGRLFVGRHGARCFAYDGTRLLGDDFPDIKSGLIAAALGAERRDLQSVNSEPVARLGVDNARAPHSHNAR